MSILALDKAQELWADPDELIKLWNDLPSKPRQEQLIAGFMKPGSVADLGCGIGRYVSVLNRKQYYGFDSSTQMIRMAKLYHPDKQFACVDIFRFQSDMSYGNILCVDVAHHQNKPVDAILQLLQLWQASNYYFTLLVGDVREDLYSSTVTPFTDLLRIFDEYKNTNVLYLERFDNEQFAWVLLEVSKWM